jgi:immune inhibitor A
MKAKWFSTLLIMVLLVIAIVPLASAAPVAADDGPIFAGRGDDNLSHPLGDEQAALKAKAMEAKLQGKGNGKTKEVAKGQFVELGLEKNDRVFVIVAEFGNSIHPSYGGAAGPLHNQIAQPNRAVDNNTIWQADFNKAHYEDQWRCY